MKYSSFVRITLLVSYIVLCFLEVNGKNEKGKGNEGKGHDKDDGLQINFYHKTCPQVEDVVRQITWKKVAANPVMSAKLLRLHYHDCFVRGCDASLLLDSVGGIPAEKDAIPNISVTGYDVIDEIKTELEQQCPDTVSCADIVAIAARDAVSFQFQKSLWNVMTGRKDGIVSIASDADTDLPSPTANFVTLRHQFKGLGLDVTDLVALSGAHTLGVAHCVVFGPRLFNFTGKNDTDPSIDPAYASILKAKCSPIDFVTTVEMDPNSSVDFDSDYFVGLRQRKGLFQSDAALLTNPTAATIATAFQIRSVFLAQFRQSIVKMGAIQVLTQDQGQIRKNCRVINP